MTPRARYVYPRIPSGSLSVTQYGCRPGACCCAVGVLRAAVDPLSLLLALKPMLSLCTCCMRPAGVHPALSHPDQHQVVARGHGQDRHPRGGHGPPHPQGQGPRPTRLHRAGARVGAVVVRIAASLSLPFQHAACLMCAYSGTGSLQWDLGHVRLRTTTCTTACTIDMLVGVTAVVVSCSCAAWRRTCPCRASLWVTSGPNLASAVSTMATCPWTTSASVSPRLRVLHQSSIAAAGFVKFLC